MPTPRYPEDYDCRSSPTKLTTVDWTPSWTPKATRISPPPITTAAPATNAGTRENSNPRLPRLKRKRKKSNPLLPVYLFRCAEIWYIK